MSRHSESTSHWPRPVQPDVDVAVQRALAAMRDAADTYAPHAYEVDVMALALLRGMTALHPDTTVEQVIDALIVRSFLVTHQEAPRG